jgi:uncharacterized protein YbcV (DUF1398 family)
MCIDKALSKSQSDRQDNRMTTHHVETVQQAQRRGAAVRPPINGFPHYAEVLRAAGITSVETSIANSGSVYHLADGAVAENFEPIAAPVSDVPDWNETALIAAIRADQAGQSTFTGFLADTWKAGVIRFHVDLANRTCTYFGATGNNYLETYPAVTIG